MMRMTTFIVGIIVIALVMTGFGLVLSDASTKYNADYDENDLAAYQQMQEMQNITENIKNRVENQTTDRNVFDVVGGFISDSKDTLMLSAKSYSVFEKMASDGMDKTNLPNVFRVSLFAIILVIVFIGIILGAILGRNL